MFKALSHPARVEILDYLNNGPLTTGELSDKFQVSRYAIMMPYDFWSHSGRKNIEKDGHTYLVS
jgi:hypothetical protein